LPAALLFLGAEARRRHPGCAILDDAPSFQSARGAPISARSGLSALRVTRHDALRQRPFVGTGWAVGRRYG